MRYFIVFVICVLPVFAQPKLVWRDYRADWTLPLWYDSTSNQLHTIRENGFEIHDAKNGQTIKSIKSDVSFMLPITPISDSVIAVHRQAKLDHINTRTGEVLPISEAVHQQLDLVDENSLIGAYDKENGPNDRRYIFVDIKGLTVVDSVDVSAFQSIALHCFDARNKIAYGVLEDQAVQLRMNGQVSQIAIPPDTKVLSTIAVVVLANGDIVWLRRDRSTDPSTHTLLKVDAASLSVVDSIGIGSQEPYIVDVFLRPNNILVVKTARDTLVSIDTKEFRVLNKFAIPEGNIGVAYHRSDASLMIRSGGNVYRYDDKLTERQLLMRDHSEIGTMIQLPDGRVLISNQYQGIQLFDPFTANRMQRLWPSVSNPNLVIIQNMVSSHSGEWLMLQDASHKSDVLIAATDSSYIKCSMVVDRRYYGGQSSLALFPEWIGDNGQSRICSYDRGEYGFGYYGLYVFPAPCIDTTVTQAWGSSQFDKVSFYTESTNRTCITTDGNIMVVPVISRAYRIQEVRVYRDLMKLPFDAYDYTVYIGASYACLTSSDTVAVVDDTEGLLCFDPRALGSERVIALNGRHKPLASMHGNDVVITYDSTSESLRAIDVVTEAVEWEMHIDYQPYRVLVAQDNHWMILEKRADYFEMYALDTVVAVKERADDATATKLFPNPASNHLVIDTDPNEVSNVTFIDQLGRVVLSTSAIGRTNVQIDALHSGAYTVVVEDKHHRQIQRLMVVR